jgi:hypothetical protein
MTPKEQNDFRVAAMVYLPPLQIAPSRYRRFTQINVPLADGQRTTIRAAMKALAGHVRSGGFTMYGQLP